MKTIILCGGLGTRISEYTKIIPKPMIMIGSKPILLHIIDTYVKYGYEDFYLALGYKKKLSMIFFLMENSKKVLHQIVLKILFHLSIVTSLK